MTGCSNHLRHGHVDEGGEDRLSSLLPRHKDAHLVRKLVENSVTVTIIITVCYCSSLFVTILVSPDQPHPSRSYIPPEKYGLAAFQQLPTRDSNL